MVPRKTFLSVALAMQLLGCGGPALRGQVYKDDGLSFRLGEIPPTWRPIHAGGARLAFRDDPAESTVLVNARCGKEYDAPLRALTQHLFMDFTERQTLEEKVVPMDGREALHTVISAKLDGVPFKFDAFVLKKDNCVYDFIDIAPPDKFDGKNREAFERFVSGFHAPAEAG